MVICVGCDPYNGRFQTNNSSKDFTINKCDPENVETLSDLFEFIKSHVTEKPIDYFCIHMTRKYENEYRKKFIEIAKRNKVKNVRIIDPQQLYLCGAIKELSVSPKMNDVIWVFFIDIIRISCWIWKFDEYSGWKLQEFKKQERVEMGKDKSPMMEDFQKLKEKMKIENQIPYIYVLYDDCTVNQDEFKSVFSRFQKIIFQKYANYTNWALNYIRFVSGEEGFSKYKSESLLGYTIRVKKNDDTEILYVNFYKVLPFSKIATIDLVNNDMLKVFEAGDFTSAIPIKKEGKYQIELNVDINGIIDFRFKLLDSNIELPSQFNDHKSFTIPQKLDNYYPNLNCIGIDLGTTECCAAVIRKNGPDFVVLDIVRNSRTMPSYIAYDEREVKFGQIVVDRMRFKAEYSVYDTKRILGRKINESIVDPLWPFEIISTSDNVSDLQIKVETLNGKDSKTCEEITADLISHIKTTLETYQGKHLTEAVITIPSEFSHNQKMATLTAAEMAGFDKIHFLPEPIAAAFAYFTEMKIPENSNILICDCGGGTVDICIAKIDNQMLEILNFDGDSHLGGRDFDTILFTHFTAILKHKFGIDVMKTNKKFVLKQKCQNIKHTLSARGEDWLDVSDFDNDSNDIIKISREEFEEMSTNLLLKIKSVICRAVSNAHLRRSQIDFVFQVGGGCRMPMIKELLKEIFPDSKLECNLYPDWAVAHGAALYAYHLKTKENGRKKMNSSF